MAADPRLSIVQKAPGHFVVAGEIDAHTAQLFGVSVAASDANTVVVDLSAVAFIDSSGLRQLLQLRQRSAVGGHGLAIMSPSRPVVRLLELSGQAEQFDIRCH